MDRLAALEAEVKADADAAAERKAEAVRKVREQRVMQAAASNELRERQAELVSKRRAPARSERDRRDRDEDRSRLREDDPLEGLGGALELAAKANRVKQELARKPKKGEKSWIASGAASLFLGPVGWLYAGSLREAIPASAGWLLLAGIASKILPAFLLMPVLAVVMPLSAIAGIVYALQYNRSGSRGRLFDREKPEAKRLPSGQ